MAELPRRPNYFPSQFLVVRDFQDEQSYHEGMLRRHNLSLHEWGVAGDGLQVTKTGDNKNLAVSPGSAIDGLGREIVLDSTGGSLKIDDVRSLVQSSGTAQDVYITIAFQESDSNNPDDKYPPPNGTVNVTRKMQTPVIGATKTRPTDGEVVLLASVRVPAEAGGDIGQPDNTVRKLASSLIARGSNLREITLDGALSFTAKNNPVPQAGLDFDSVTDTLRIRARTTDAPALDDTHVTIQRESGNVGIGTLPTAARLSISAAPTEGTLVDFAVAQYQLALRYKSLERDTVSYFFDLVNNGDVRFDNFLAFHKGNVGIGTPKPLTALQVGKDGSEGSPCIRIGWGGDDNADRLTIYNSDPYNMGLRRGSRDLRIFAKSPDGDGHIYLMPNNAIAMTLLSNGNVGIGTTDVPSRLMVRGAEKLVPTVNVSSTLGESDNAVYFLPNVDVRGSIRVGDWVAIGDERKEVIEVYPTFIRVRPPGFRYGNKPLFVVRPGDIFRADDLKGNLKLLINGEGNVGIGTPTPSAPLHIGVASRVPHKIDDQYALMGYQWNSNRGNDFRNGLSDSNQPQYFDNTSICAEGRIVSLEFNAFSDSRIKKSLSVSDSSDALKMLKQLCVTDYQFKDSLAHGDQYHKGFIAEEVEQFFPQAVSKRSDFIPDIYALAEETTLVDEVLTVSLRDAHDLAAGDMVRLITEADGVKEVSVTVVDEKTFAIKNWTGTNGKLFVHGKRVDDFRSLDYQQILSLGISGLQQLSIEVDELKAANGALKARLQLLESKLATAPNGAAAQNRSNGNNRH